jgi:hypothetical protein
MGKRPPADLADAELRGGAGDPDVGRLQDLGAAGDAGALDGGDERLLQAVVAEEGLPVQVGVGGEAGLPLVVGRVVHLLEVTPGREVAAGAGEDGDPDAVVAVDHLPGIGQAGQHLQIERVARLGAVHDQGDDVTFALDQQVAHGPTIPACLGK